MPVSFSHTKINTKKYINYVNMSTILVTFLTTPSDPPSNPSTRPPPPAPHSHQQTPSSRRHLTPLLLLSRGSLRLISHARASTFACKQKESSRGELATRRRPFTAGANSSSARRNASRGNGRARACVSCMYIRV